MNPERTGALPATAPRGSLAWRLGLLLGGIVLVVLLVIGIVVNRVVSSGYQSVLAAQQQERLQTAADALVDAIARPAPAARVRAQVQRLAVSLGGVVTVLGPNGRVIVAAGRQPTGDTATLEAPIVSDGQQLGTLHATLPAGVADQGFLRLFNLTLVGAGLLEPHRDRGAGPLRHQPAHSAVAIRGGRGPSPGQWRPQRARARWDGRRVR